MSNDYTSTYNISYDSLMNCSLYELVYWIEKSDEKIKIAEERYEKSK